MPRIVHFSLEEGCVNSGVSGARERGGKGGKEEQREGQREGQRGIEKGRREGEEKGQGEGRVGRGAEREST